MLQLQMPTIDFDAIMRHLTETGNRTHTVWQQDGTLAFVARGRPYRSEYHLNPSWEIQHSIRGDLDLWCRTPEGTVEIHHVPEGSCLFQPPFVPHSPRFGPAAFQFIIERMRAPGEVDKFHWYCPSCDAFLHEELFVVDDYRKDPVSRAYDRFYASEAARTCKACGTVMPAP